MTNWTSKKTGETITEAEYDRRYNALDKQHAAIEDERSDMAAKIEDMQNKLRELEAECRKADQAAFDFEREFYAATVAA